ncbi:40S RIBOSOMAL PROTEIN S10 [Salix purpurea]|uniref:40S RIBOSOMAL PROTEIN S10 n=1 Tax=Salix purpurea TaxID=77065 RepID=A0A9Q0WYC5_SALPP|nr:40S RIBOSOMAL PROTEIN S10 [Salix purpurea]KAJ6775314.1 40S RIBOSOMAL PROTEIN S10 [Salix purpurea]KAJ6775315.1 40S RIBOSOMAL PROTEIN S10 [Salix purpurea]
MTIPEKNRREISKYLFQEGVCYAKKDSNLGKHPEIDVPNLQVIKLMQSFKYKEYVRETFAWMYYYWYLTIDGIEFLRTYLNLPSEAVPATLLKQSKPAGGRPFGGPPGDRPRDPPRFEGDRPRFGDRDGYRGGPRGGEGGEKGGAPADYQPAFRMDLKGLQYKSNLFGIAKEFETANITDSLKMELMKTPFWTLIESMLEGTLDKHICRKSDLSICKILQTYNKDEEVFRIKGKDIKIYAEDIRLIFGIRDGNIQIDVNKHKTARMRNKTAFETRCFPKVERLTKREINNAFKRLNNIESKNPSDRNVQDMCRVLVLKLLVSLFLPNNGSNLPFAYLEYVEDLESIAEYNWAAHIFDF